ncbi:hypothetical protein [Marinomonas colpomeniae]|uniref:Uncharacterized protein n=1 Tax=Marinomonas colpomeniae TaxID=2774408 RepID=A0ABR8NTS9_9GAMM|nr:hypothetical protein [Marinomonas colpomeniae]MBD5769459.1 hypothetical protein [Marinomonas colpomeniae]
MARSKNMHDVKKADGGGNKGLVIGGRGYVPLFMSSMVFIVALVWAVAEGGKENLEPYVALFGGAAALLSFIFINTKKTRPELAINLTHVLAFPQDNEPEELFSINIANHSKERVYIKSLNFNLNDAAKSDLVHATDRLGKSIGGALIDAGQSISFKFLKARLTKQLIETSHELESICVYDQLGYKFDLKDKYVKTIREEIEKRKGHSIE